MYVRIKGVKMDMIINFSWNFKLVIFMILFDLRPITSNIIQLMIDVSELFYTFMIGNLMSEKIVFSTLSIWILYQIF